MSHLGRPHGQRVPALSLAPVAERLSQLLGRAVGMAPDCVGAEVAAQAAALQPGQILLLENVRFHPEEEQNEQPFAQQLAELGDAYVNGRLWGRRTEPTLRPKGCRAVWARGLVAC